MPDMAQQLSLSRETLFYIVTKAREFDAKVAPVDPDPGSNEADDGERSILEDRADDPTLAELKEAIDDLNVDESTELVALAWLGRGDFAAGEWQAALALARQRHSRHTTDYLVGIPMLGDLVEEGVAMLGYNLEDEEMKHL